MAYTKQYWLEELRDQLTQVTNDLAKTTDLRNLQVVKVEMTSAVSNKLKSDILNAYQAELDALNASVEALLAKRADLSVLIMYLESHGDKELQRPIPNFTK